MLTKISIVTTARENKKPVEIKMLPPPEVVKAVKGHAYREAIR